jgi:molybdopterin/thiamine biosynthesis adenylyltransferase
MQVDKYDRQIRLWGKNGQKRLGEATVALLGASGAGIEALKNLVLPGVGNIEIWAEGNV